MKIGILGLGSIGMRHAKNLTSLGIQVLAHDPSPKHLMDEWTEATRAKAVAESDAVIIATPTSNHAHDLRDCLQAGKHVFIEKPIAAEASVLLTECLAVAKHGKLVVFVGNNLRYHACVRAAKEKLVMGTIGNPIWASVTVGQYTQKEPYLRDGVTLNWGAHEIDMALYLLGPATVLFASEKMSLPLERNHTGPPDRYNDISDFVLLHDESRCRSSVHLDYVTNPEIRATTIVGTKGQITIDLVQRWGCISTADGQRQTFQATDSWDMNYLDEMKGFLNRIHGQNDGIGASGEDGLATLKIIKAIKEKAKQ